MSGLPTIIGLSGVARAGKDTVADILKNLYGYEIYSFSETLNDALVALNPWVPTMHNFGRETIYVRYADLIADLGYEKAKEFEEVRRLLQAMGTEVGRNLLGEKIWVDALFEKIWRNRSQFVVITNVRFPNEYLAAKQEGVVWRVERPGFEPALGHISDTALDGFDFDAVIQNDGTIEELAQKVIGTLHPLQGAYS